MAVHDSIIITHISVADPGFPVGGGRGPRTGGRGPPRRLRFENFACQNERIWTHRGGARRARPPLDPPMYLYHKNNQIGYHSWQVVIRFVGVTGCTENQLFSRILRRFSYENGRPLERNCNPMFLFILAFRINGPHLQCQKAYADEDFSCYFKGYFLLQLILQHCTHFYSDQKIVGNSFQPIGVIITGNLFIKAPRWELQ